MVPLTIWKIAQSWKVVMFYVRVYVSWRHLANQDSSLLSFSIVHSLTRLAVFRNAPTTEEAKTNLLLKSDVRTKNISVKTDNDVNIVWNRESIVDLFRSILIALIFLFLVDEER